jgi:prepilin-type N-terminal cleavage/methylation domain-containing protein
MNWTLRGFTIVEVLLALAISGAILAASISIFAGRREDTQFDQAVYDLQSKLNSYVNQVSTKFVPGYKDYKCNLSGAPARPVLTPIAATSDETTGQECIYLGDAIEVIKTTGDSLYAYPVFGARTVAGSTAFDYPRDIASANPEMAVDASGNPVLNDTYPLLGGLKIVYAQVGGNERDLLGIYSNLYETNTSGNEVTPYVYNVAYTSVGVASTIPSVQNCIRGGCSLTAMSSYNSWQLCVTNDKRSALIKVFATATGINSNIVMKASADCS